MWFAENMSQCPVAKKVCLKKVLGMSQLALRKTTVASISSPKQLLRDFCPPYKWIPYCCLCEPFKQRKPGLFDGFLTLLRWLTSQGWEVHGQLAQSVAVKPAVAQRELALFQISTGSKLASQVWLQSAIIHNTCKKATKCQIDSGFKEFFTPISISSLASRNAASRRSFATCMASRRRPPP